MPPVRPEPLRSENSQFRQIEILRKPDDPSGHLIGDQFVYSDDLFDDKNQKVGHHSGFCTLVRVTPGNDPDIYQCVATFKLPDGQVTARGLLKSNIPPAVGLISTFGISGGTDDYDNIRGEVTVTVTGPGKQDYKFRIHS